MRKIKLYKLYYWTAVFELCAYGSLGISLCAKKALELGMPEFDTLCDLEFCTCRDSFGRVRCLCPAQDPDEGIIIKRKGSCSIPPDTTSLSLENCKKVAIAKDAFHEVQSLTSLNFINVTEVAIEGTLFPSNGPVRSIHFMNSTIPDLPSFSFAGNLDSVIFDACHIGSIKAFAFSNINSLDRILFYRTTVVNVESQAFKKFTVNKLLIIDSRFDIIPSRFVADIMVETIFKIESTYINAIQTLGFKITNPKKVLVINSMINRLHEEAFKIVTRGEVVIENNILNNIDNEAFRGISVDKFIFVHDGKQKFKFRNQTVSNLEKRSLYFNRTAFDVQFEKFRIDQACTCDGLDDWRSNLGPSKEIAKLIDSDWSMFYCLMGRSIEESNFVQGLQFYNDHCTKLTFGIYFFVIIIMATAIVLLITITVIVCIIKRRRRKWKYVPSAAQDSRRKDSYRTNDKKKRKKEPVQGRSETSKAMIVPDGRTYKETEFHIIVEKAEPLNEECITHAVVRDRSHTQISPPSKA